MKKILYLATFALAVSLNAYSSTPHSTDQYEANPQLALSDAKQMLSEERYDDAHDCYVIYGTLTNSDVSHYIADVESKRHSLPSWFDSKTMRVVGTSAEGSLIIVFNKLHSVDIWDPDFNGEMSIAGTPGVWDCRTRPFVIRALHENGFNIPADGLFGKMQIDSFIENRELENTRTGEITVLPNEETYIQAVLYRHTGDGYAFDGGSYYKEGKLVGGQVKIMEDDQRNHKTVYFYPVKLLVKNQNNWVEKGLFDKDIQDSNF